MMGAMSTSPAPARTPRRRQGSLALIVGIATILVVAALLAIDVALRGGVIVPRAPLPEPTSLLGRAARWAAINTTPLCWTGYLLVLDGLMTRAAARRATRETSPVRRSPRRVALCYLTSIPVWLVFDGINFAVLDAWTYHGLPEDVVRRYVGYALAFGAITPAMLLTAEGLRRLGLQRARGPRVPIGPATGRVLVALGLLCAIFPFVVRQPIGTLTLWLSLALVLDPLNHRLGAASVVGDWRAGRYGRTLALLAAGLWCGLLWELWNYWAAAKWTYTLPFLGRWEHVRYFEMPVLGLLGFLPFALECWAAFVTLAWLAQRLGLRGVALDAEADEVI